MNFSFHPEAEADLFGAADWYEAQEPGLGRSFALEVTSALLRILDFPDAWPGLDGEIRRCLVHRFPFGILYVVEQNDVFVLAVMHLHREPGHWKDRRSEGD